MELNYKTIISVILSAALLISVLALTGVFEKGEIILSKTTDAREIEVYIVGEIQSPGIYKMKKGCILNDLIEAAGGLKDTVDVEYINLAFRIDDNMMIQILNSSIIKMDDEEGLNTFDEKLSGLMVNINTAGVSELVSIPGIGEATANAIISYRNINGAYERPEDIMNVAGIKQAKFNSIKEFICVN